MDPSKMGSKSGGGGLHASEEFGAADQQGGNVLESSSSATNPQQPTVAPSVQQVAHVDIDPVGQQCAAVTNRGNPWDVSHTGMMQPNVLPVLQQVLLSPLAPPPHPTADLNLFQFPTNQQEQHHHRDGENWQPPRYVQQQPMVATAVQVAHVDIDPMGQQCEAVTNRGNLFQTPAHPQPLHNSPENWQPPRYVHQQPTVATAVQVAHVDIDPVGQAVTNRSNLFQTPAHPQPLHNSPEGNGWGRHHPQLEIVEPGTLINGSHARATPHTAIAKFPLSREKPYFEVTIGNRRGEMSVGLCAKSAPINKRFDHGLHSNNSPFTATDIIGCGVLFNTERAVVVIYTINGQIMGKRIMKGEDVMSELYPFVTMEGPQDRIKAIFEGKFTYEFKTED